MFLFKNFKVRKFYLFISYFILGLIKGILTDQNKTSRRKRTSSSSYQKATDEDTSQPIYLEKARKFGPSHFDHIAPNTPYILTFLVR